MKWLFRPMELADSDLVFQWRNSPEVYRYLFQAKPVAESEHKRWFEAILQNKSVLFLLAALDGVPAGTVRFDLNKAEDEIEVGIYLAPEFHGKGLGKIMLVQAEAECLARFPQVKKVIAKVLVENVASEKMFEQAGYKKHFVQLEKLVGK